ncbi:MAG TPA: glycosyltransferase, partial [Chitinophagaceae bacterium]|nr:glycosyltransferase [Chitinophagaceae bacterium]
IIMDDASTDNSRDIIELFRDDPRVRHIIFNPVNSGSPFRQWSNGFTYTTGDWVWIAESDDTASPLFLEKMLAATTGKNGLAFVFCDSFISKPGNIKNGSFAANKNLEFKTDKWSSPFYKDGKEEINESLKWSCSVNNASAVLFNRAHLGEVIKNIQSFRYHGDWMLYLLLANAGTITYIPEALNTYREHEKNHSATDEQQRAFRTEHFRILDQLLELEYVTEKEKVFDHFIDRYTGFGFLSGPAFGKKGIFRQYAAINPKLARKTISTLLWNKLKRKKTG